MKKGIVFPKGRGVPFCVSAPVGPDFHWMKRMIDVDWIEIVHPRRLPEGYVMIVDEEGLLKDNEINYVGSWFYESDKHGEPIVGNVLILKEVYGEDGPECVGMTDDEVNMIFSLIGKEG